MEFKQAESVYDRLDRLSDKFFNIVSELSPYKGDSVDKDNIQQIHKLVNDLKLDLNQYANIKTMNRFEEEYLKPACYKSLHQTTFRSNENNADLMVDELANASYETGYAQKMLNDEYDIVVEDDEEEEEYN